MSRTQKLLAVIEEHRSICVITPNAPDCCQCPAELDRRRLQKQAAVPTPEQVDEQRMLEREAGFNAWYTACAESEAAYERTCGERG